MKRHITLAIFAGIATLVVGCAQKTIVGKWSGMATAPNGMKSNLDEEFKADGTASLTLNIGGRSLTLPSTYKAENGTLTVNSSMPNSPTRSMSQTFQYKLDGDTLTMNSQYEPQPIVLKRQP